MTKYTAGYPLRPGMDWIDLFCGSEGTLGVVMEAELALLPIVEELFTAIIFFSNDDDALNAVDAWRPVPGLRMLEYVDRNALDIIRPRFPDIPQQATAALLIEAEGEPDLDAWERRLKAANALVDASWFAMSAQDRERFRRFRHTLPETVIDTVRKRGFKQIGTDYAVPLTETARCCAFIISVWTPPTSARTCASVTLEMRTYISTYCPKRRNRPRPLLLS